MNEQNLERLGRMVDEAENYIGFSKLMLPPVDTVDALLTGIKALRDEVKAIYLSEGGEDVWEIGDYN